MFPWPEWWLFDLVVHVVRTILWQLVMLHLLPGVFVPLPTPPTHPSTTPTSPLLPPTYPLHYTGLKVVHAWKNHLKRPKIQQEMILELNCIIFNRLLRTFQLNKNGLAHSTADYINLNFFNWCFFKYYQVRSFVQTVTYNSSTFWVT